MKLFNQIFKGKRGRHLAQDLLLQSKKEADEINPVNIIVAGKTGSGKSTLINAIFRERLAETGVGQPITQHLEKISKAGVPLILYDTKGLELTAQAQHEVLKSLASLIKDNKGTDQAIDLVYYCINSMSKRIESFEMDLIKAMAQHVPVILVLTQNIVHDQSFYHYLKELNLPVVDIIPVLAKTYIVRGQQAIPTYGLQELIEATMRVIPEGQHKAFINAQRIDVSRKVEAARSWAKKYITTAFGVGFTPIPIADSAVLVPMQITMMAHITAIFGLSLELSQIVSIVAGMGGTGGATYLGKFFSASLLKLIPGIGTTTGSLITGVTASLMTLALAYSYIEVLKQIALRELTGRDMKLREIQRLMNKNLKEQLMILSHHVPNSINESLDLFKGFW